MPEIKIAGRGIGAEHPPFIVAEAGINHNGNLDRALAMVRCAREAGADAIKFQTFRADEFVGDPRQMFTYRSQGREVTEPMLDMFRRCELAREEWVAIKQECDRCGILFFSTPQNPSDLALLLELGVPAIKVGSDDFTNLPLIERYAAAGLPLILSCGMADMAEVKASLAAAGALTGRATVLLLCTSQYPTPPADVHLRKLATLREAFPNLVLGFSDHTQGHLAAAMATAFGAAVFEKHFTLDRDLPGPDHWFSADPSELSHWVQAIRTAHAMLGSATIEPTASEREMRTVARRSITLLCDVARGETLDGERLGLRRPGNGLPPAMLRDVLGRKAARDLKAGEMLRLEDVQA